MVEKNSLNIQVTTELWKNQDGLHLNVVTDLAGQVTKKTIALEEKATIDALTRLGWTPPNTARKDELLEALKRAGTIIHGYSGVYPPNIKKAIAKAEGK